MRRFIGEIVCCIGFAIALPGMLIGTALAQAGAWIVGNQNGQR